MMDIVANHVGYGDLSYMNPFKKPSHFHNCTGSFSWLCHFSYFPERIEKQLPEPPALLCKFPPSSDISDLHHHQKRGKAEKRYQGEQQIQPDKNCNIGRRFELEVNGLQAVGTSCIGTAQFHQT